MIIITDPYVILPVFTQMTLKQAPDKIYITKEFTAVWSSVLDQFVVVHEDLRMFTKEEVIEKFCEKIDTLSNTGF